MQKHMAKYPLNFRHKTIEASLNYPGVSSKKNIFIIDSVNLIEN